MNGKEIVIETDSGWAFDFENIPCEPNPADNNEVKNRSFGFACGWIFASLFNL